MATKYTPGSQFTVDGKTYKTASGTGYDAVLVQPGAAPTTTPTNPKPLPSDAYAAAPAAGSGYNYKGYSSDSGSATSGYTRDAAGNVQDAQGKDVTYASLPKGADGKPLMNLDNLPLRAGSSGYTRTSSGDVYNAQGTKVNYADLPKGPDGRPLMNLDNLPLRPVADANADADIISDTSEQQSEIKTQNQKLQEQLAGLGIEPPEDTVSPLIEEVLKGLRDRAKEMDAREKEDIESIKKSYEVAGEEQKISQEEALAKAEGRVRYGGFITKMETDEIQDLQRKFRLENMALEGQKSVALLSAQRSYNDSDFELAQLQLEAAQKADEDLTQKKQQYFENIQTVQAFYERLNKPAIEAAETDQQQMLSMMSSAPSAFLDIKPSDIMLNKLTYGEVAARYVDSKEYQAELAGELLTPTEAARLGLPYGTTKTRAANLGIVPKFGTGDEDGGEDEDEIDSYARRLNSGELKISNIPANVRGQVLTRAKDFAVEDLSEDIAIGNSQGLTREQLIDQLGPAYSEFSKQEIRDKVYEQIPDRPSGDEQPEEQGFLGSFFSNLFKF